MPTLAPVRPSASHSRSAIDSTNRIVSLKDKDNVTEEIACGPEVPRFDQLEVGDRVTFRYYESVVSTISRTGSASKTGEPTAAVTRTAGARPGGTIAQQLTATVTISAIDPKVPSVTVTGPNGNKMSFKVDKKNIEGYKAGDKVAIT